METRSLLFTVVGPPITVPAQTLSHHFRSDIIPWQTPAVLRAGFQSLQQTPVNKLQSPDEVDPSKLS